jgi:MYXO-CTERM domain-containing protein
MRNAVRTWIERVEEFGVEAIVYSGRYFWQDYVASTEWNDHPFWIAHYTNACPNIPSQWADWDFWQYTDKGSVSGVSGDTDMNRFNGTLAMLQALRPEGGDGGGAPPASCGRLAADAATVIDNTDDCFALGGPNQYWRSENAGYDGDMNWTRSTTGTEYNFGTWSLNFDEAARYGLQIYVDENHTTATVAKYAVTHADGVSTVTVNQTGGGWIDLGMFEFEAGDVGHQVRLSDKTGQGGKQLAFDALRIVPEGVDPGEECDDGHATPRQDGEGVGDFGDRGGEAMGCRVGGSGTPAWWLLSLGFLGLVRRRRV